VAVITPGPGGGYVAEGIVCRLRRKPKPPFTVELFRMKLRDSEEVNWILTAEPEAHDSYEVDGPALGYVFTTEQWSTVPLYELQPVEGKRRHFYTTGRAEADRAVLQKEYEKHRVIYHVLPPPIDRRRLRSIAGVIGLALAAAGAALVWGDKTWVHRLTAGWVLVAGLVAGATYLIGVAVGRRPFE
jgi:hypothetical protein